MHPYDLFSYSSLALSGLTLRFTPGVPLAFPIDDWHMFSKACNAQTIKCLIRTTRTSFLGLPWTFFLP
jgi:hypothetical protein